MEAIALVVLVAVLVAGVAAARRGGLLAGSPEDLDAAARAEDAARAAPHVQGPYPG